MSERLPRTLSYASASTDAPVGGRAFPWRMVIAAAWLAVLLWAIFAAWRIFGDQQDDVGGIASNGSLAAGALFVVGVPDAFWAVGVGALAAALLWHWPRRRLVWLILLPACVGAWRCGQCFMAMSNPPLSVVGMIVGVAMVQCLLVWLGAWCGHWIARWLAILLLPPVLAGELLPLWSR